MIERRTFGRLLIAIFFLLVAHTTLAQPSGELRFDIERIAVAVQVFDVNEHRPLERGSGFVIADDGQTLTLVTAEHVVASARDDDSLTVRVLFHGTGRWVDAELDEPLPADDGRAIDAATLSVPRDWAPVADRYPIAQLTPGPDPIEGDSIWTFALDLNTGHLRWREAVAGTSDGQMISFSGASIHPGCSGAVLISNSGPIGIVTQAGAQRSGHRAIRMNAVLEHIAPRNLSVIVREDPLGDALANTFQRQLAIGMFIWSPKTGNQTRSGWAAIELTEAGSNRYEGSVISTEGGARCALEFINGSWVLRITGATRIHQNPPINLSGSITLRAQTDVTIPGFVIMNLDHDDAGLQLAIPLTNTEMLAARSILSNRQGTKATPESQDEQNVLGIWVNRDRRVRGVFPPFVLNLGPGASLSFTLERRHHRSREVRLVGELVDVDMLRTRTQGHDLAMIEQWRSIDLVVQPAGGGAEQRFATSMAQRGEVQIIFPPDAGRFTIGNPDLVTQGNTSVAAATAPLLINARLIYAD